MPAQRYNVSCVELVNAIFAKKVSFFTEYFYCVCDHKRRGIKTFDLLYLTLRFIRFNLSTAVTG